MCLTLHNQLTLLQDLLTEQLTNQVVSVEEYTQIKKVIQKLMISKLLNSELQQILPEIYHFGIKGELTSSINDHVNSYERKLIVWLQMIEYTKTLLPYIDDKKIQ